MYRNCVESVNKTFPAKTLEFLAADAFCDPETRIQDLSVIVDLTSLSQYGDTVRFTVHLLNDPIASSRDFPGIDLALLFLAEQALLKWVLLDFYVLSIEMAQYKTGMHTDVIAACVPPSPH